MTPKLWILIVALAVIARARVAVLPGWVVPLPVLVLVLAAELTACAAFVAWLLHRAHRPAPAPAPAGGPS
jgi:hypothetical protein